jgi:hypothetical protein
MEKISFESATYKGRVICDAVESGNGYCGSVSFELHCKQLSDQESWVHSSKERWLRAYVQDANKGRMDEIYKAAEVEIAKMVSDAIES